eukprot:5718469-Pyramimonas_sp.AAC.1
MLTSSVTGTLAFLRRSSRAFALSPRHIFALTISWARMPAALHRARACHSAAEMRRAWPGLRAGRSHRQRRLGLGRLVGPDVTIAAP